jgi:hypothetical protein
MSLFKGIYKIARWTGVVTPFHKKYYVFDGLGLIFFDSLIEARSYVSSKSSLFEKIYNESKFFYKKLSDLYFDRLIKFRLLDSESQLVNNLLRECVFCYSFLSRTFFVQYVLLKLKYIYDCFLNISNILKMNLLYRRIKSLYDSFFVPYPEYCSVDSSPEKIKNILSKKAI